MRHLGIQIHYRRLTLAEWKLVERLQKRLSSWKGKLLSLGGRLILINSVLSNMVLHMISLFLLPKGVLHKLDYYRSRFFWQGTLTKRNIDWLNGMLSAVPKTRVGLAFMTLRSRIQLTRFIPGNAHVSGLSIHGALVGAWRIRRLQTETGGAHEFTQVRPPGG
jgi:hypothetical protein